MSQFDIKAAVTPVIRFAPERFRKQDLPAFLSPVSIMRAVVVFPFVPVTAITFTPRERKLSISFFRKSANFPGKVVAPLPNRRRSFSHSFAAANGLTNCTFLAGDVLKVVDELREKPDIIVVDPPRDGIHPKALGKIIDFGVDRMVYISCKPTSLARDLTVLLERGYRAERVCCVDMFPFTGNVETVVLLSKLKTDKHIEVELEMDELD